MTCVQSVAFAALIAISVASSGEPPCPARMQTEAGWVCGQRRSAINGFDYLSFRGVPYAKQPVGELRFKELQPPEPWQGDRPAKEEGPVCYQTDTIYGRLAPIHAMSEECIFANIHVPPHALPSIRITRQLNPVQVSLGANHRSGTSKVTGLPILVVIHGGGFAVGSGNSNLHGPEYLVARGVVVVTFNYRLGAVGFLSLNSSSIPGNQGLRDMVTLLRWVKRNAKYFGGDPENISVLGQSSGAAAAHLLSMSKAAEGLFKRAVIMSGSGNSNFMTTSPLFAQTMKANFLQLLGINPEDPPEDIYRQLIDLPIQKINDANDKLIETYGVTSFFPTVESSFPGVTRIVDDDPDALIDKGRGKNIPLIIGFTNSECEFFRHRFEEIDIINRIKTLPTILVSLKLTYSEPKNSLENIACRVEQKYFNGTLTMDNYIKLCSDNYYVYPALKLAEMRGDDGAPVFLYRFSYNSDKSVIKEALDLNYHGAAHVEDLTYAFKTNSMMALSQAESDELMRRRMSTFVTDFMKCSSPICNDKSLWPPVDSKELKYQNINRPQSHYVTVPPSLVEMVEFFDSL